MSSSDVMFAPNRIPSDLIRRTNMFDFPKKRPETEVFLVDVLTANHLCLIYLHSFVSCSGYIRFVLYAYKYK